MTAREWIIWFAVLASVITIVVWFNKLQPDELFSYQIKTCHAKWGDAFETRWAMFSGCQIKLTDGRWIPADSYRELPK